MKQPIPDNALDDRLGFVGTAGSGKTYNAMGRVERLLRKNARVCCVDPLGVFWGLRLMPDGKTESGFNIPIFGGPHGDLPLTEHSGALIGETVAGMAESCIIDLSDIGTKAGERRFMLHFLTALYRKSKDEPLHLVIDEADMFAPQKLLDKEGEAAKLLGMMETVVRRGRIKGFIPWLITQRPAVIAKDILSQVDGLIAFKLTSSHDRDALSAWVEGSADKEDWKTMRAALPAMERGQGVVWIPGRGIMETVIFPEKLTFDSSRTPKRGEKRSTASLNPLDLGSLKERLAKVDAERKADDPKTLKTLNAKLEAEIRSLRKPANAAPEVDVRWVERARREGYDLGLQDAVGSIGTQIETLTKTLADHFEHVGAIGRVATGMVSWRRDFLKSRKSKELPKSVQPTVTRTAVDTPMRTPKPMPAAGGNGALSGPEQKIVDAIRWWNVMGVDRPTHAQVGFIAKYAPKSGTWSRYLSALRSGGYIEPRGDLVLTSAGESVATEPEAPPTSDALRSAVLEQIDGPLQRIMRPILNAHPLGLSHDEAAEASGYAPGTGTWSRYLSALRSKELIEKTGTLKAQGWLFP